MSEWMNEGIIINIMYYYKPSQAILPMSNELLILLFEFKSDE